MMIRRIFAGSIVALMFSVCSLAAACDISCAFASMNSDCHSDQTGPQGSPSAGMTMDGMAMPGMTMPEMANSEDQPTVSAISQGMANHPSIGEMGPCEKQACDNGSTVSTTATRSGNSYFHSILAVTEIPPGNGALKLLRDPRDDIATNQFRDSSPLHISLRI
jgi:hypothetical protein